MAKKFGVIALYLENVYICRCENDKILKQETEKNKNRDIY